MAFQTGILHVKIMFKNIMMKVHRLNEARVGHGRVLGVACIEQTWNNEAC